MSSKDKSDISSNSQPINKGKQKDMTSKETSKEASPKSISRTTQPETNDTTSRGKRPLSSPQAESSKKRQDNKPPSSLPPSHLSYTDLPANWSPPSPPTDNPQPLQLTYHKGDIFSELTPNTLLIHACNTQGHWGAGIAKAFKTNYPKAYKAHHDFCAKEHSKASPVPTGTTQLLAPVPGDGDTKTWIGCVFTSARYGKMKDRPEEILRNTGRSMEMLLELVKVASERDGEGVGVIRMCKINSGKFGVPWERTEKVLKAIVLREGWTGTVEVWEP